MIFRLSVVIYVWEVSRPLVGPGLHSAVVLQNYYSYYSSFKPSAEIMLNSKYCVLLCPAFRKPFSPMRWYLWRWMYTRSHAPCCVGRMEIFIEPSPGLHCGHRSFLYPRYNVHTIHRLLALLRLHFITPLFRSSQFVLKMQSSFTAVKPLTAPYFHLIRDWKPKDFSISLWITSPPLSYSK